MKKSGWPLLVLVMAGCGPKAQQLEDGTFQVKCETGLAYCARKAQQICRDQGYRVLSGTEGQTADSNQLQFVCEGQPLPTPPPSHRPEPPPPAVPARTEPAKPTRACIPGTTQRCVGAGACEGGQACLPDGSGYGRCECAAKPSLRADAGA